jgi:hypothetical protein
MRAVHANCFPDGDLRADVLLTDEVSVAHVSPVRAELLDDGIDPGRGHAVGLAAWELARSWYLDPDGSDPTVVGGISAGDLAAAEAAQTVLLPAARGLLGGVAARERGLEVDELLLVTASPGAPGHYARVEGVSGAAVALGLGAERVEHGSSSDPRNEWLRAKYARTRDIDWLAPPPDSRPRLRAAVLALVNAAGAVRRRPSLYVLEYNPTRAFARAYGESPKRSLRLVRDQPPLDQLAAIARAGDRALMPELPRLEAIAAPEIRVPAGPFELAGHDLAPVVAEELARMVDRYARFVVALGPRMRRRLEQFSVRALLVPFDTPPYARLLVRTAQLMGLPTLVLNDGFKTDELQREGFTADVALTWSPLMADHYFTRRPGGARVTGNPAGERIPAARPQWPPRRVLVGGFTYSPIDVNCRRSDPERFTTEVIEGVRRALPDAELTLKLHPADDEGHYGALVDGKGVELVISGDVVDRFDRCDAYVTTYSTSLLEAVAAGLPVVYYRVNEQRIGPPFDGDEWLGRRTAGSPTELAALLRDPEALREPPPDGWVERVLGPRDKRATERILDAVGEAMGGLPETR